MKKLSKLFAGLLVLVFVLTACSEEATVFEKEGMKLTMTGEFKESPMPGYTFAAETSDAGVLALKEGYAEYPDLNGISLDEYKQMIMTNNAQFELKEADVEGVVALEHTAPSAEGEGNLTFFTSLHQAPDGFWFLQFTCEEKDYEEYRPLFIDWSKKVEFKNADSGSTDQAEPSESK